MKKALKLVAFAIGAVVLAVMGWCIYYPTHELPLARSPIEFSISAGSSLRAATQQMVQAGVVDNPTAFSAQARRHCSARRRLAIRR